MNHVNMRLRLARIPYTHGLPDQLVSALVWNGQQGVQIFFAVSGFLITSTALRRWGDRTPIRDFYRLRFARIAPLLLALLAILSVLHLAQVKNFVINPKVATLPKALFAALTFNVNVLEAQHGYLPANWDILWSLSVEEVFYFCFPLVRRYKPLFIAALQGVPKALVEAAVMDGAGYWRRFFRIVLPWISPVVFFAIVYASIGALQVFESIVILTQGGPGDATRSMSIYIVEEAFDSFEIGYAASVAVIMTVVILAITVLQFMASRAWVRH